MGLRLERSLLSTGAPSHEPAAYLYDNRAARRLANPALFLATTQGSKSSSFIQWPFLTAAVVGGSWPCPQMFNHHHSPRFDPGVPGRVRRELDTHQLRYEAPRRRRAREAFKFMRLPQMSVAAVLIHIPDAEQINPPTVAEELNEKI